ncbi:uncharacterized protein MEPE_04095 [Melanopsichium pennsylvanicum]|uniref:Hypervirulence associated protein TUDOR domain-containing protein n=1 Tax=Melanopsichium pennsylvanicum TaxID=63383 RepID=A0AAJ4XP66_9BASI|nr:uncharacterized protein MEPE_04095 [Melanopsichium pennsylvanicum]
MLPKKATANNASKEPTRHLTQTKLKPVEVKSDTLEITSTSTKRKSDSTTTTTTTFSSKRPKKKEEDENKKEEKESNQPCHSEGKNNLSKSSLQNKETHGQNVTWKAMQGWVHGKIVESLKSTKQVDGKNNKATQQDPKIVLKSHGPTGKIAIHKPSAFWFD